MDFDATSLYPSAMWDESSVYPERETGFAFAPHMNDVYVKAFNDQTFNEDGIESAILGIKYYSPPNLIFQHLPVKEKVKNVEVNRMRNGYIVDTLTSVDICDNIKFGGKVIEIYEVLFIENTLRHLHLEKLWKIFCFEAKVQRRTKRFNAGIS